MVQIKDTFRTREDVYVDNDNQIQSNEEIGYQEPMPCGIEELELSWDRKKGFMRIIIKDQGTWYFKELMGKAQLLSADSERGRLYIRAIPFLDGDTLYLARDPESVAHERLEEDDIAESLQKTNNRLCYNRQETCCRMRDERKPWIDNCSRRLVADYVGDISIEWNRDDIVAHIFHKGEILLDNENVAHLYDAELNND